MKEGNNLNICTFGYVAYCSVPLQAITSFVGPKNQAKSN